MVSAMNMFGEDLSPIMWKRRYPSRAGQSAPFSMSATSHVCCTSEAVALFRHDLTDIQLKPPRLQLPLYSNSTAMASIVRPALFKQCCNATIATRAFTTTSRTTLRTTPFRTATPLIRQLPRSPCVRDATPVSSRIAAFHAEGRKSILPPLPRTSTFYNHTPRITATQDQITDGRHRAYRRHNERSRTGS